ncbi:YkvA family protein [Streptomyces avidinii]|uniref:YkvA family protein n=1 Tax=Streptomyces avidinii TaxID=1895 RepID=UPI0037B21181|nr:YkvA family protein [Streptomyces avidinii]
MSELSTGVLIVLAIAVLAMLGVAIVLAVKLVKISKLLRSEDLPLSNKVAFWASLVYTVSPVDLIPDPVYLDDIGVLLLTIHFIQNTAKRLGVLTGPASDGVARIER